MIPDQPRFRPARNPLNTERARGHRHVGGSLGRGPQERHWIIAGVVVTVVAAAASAYASYEQAQTQKGIAKFQQKVAENNAIAQRQAAGVEAENLRDKQRMILASQRAGIGASGVLGSEGTPLVVQSDSAEKAALNEARVRYSGEVNARAQEAEAIVQGYVNKRAGRQGYVNAGATLLSGAGSAASAYGGSKRGRATTVEGA